LNEIKTNDEDEKAFPVVTVFLVLEILVWKLYSKLNRFCTSNWFL